MKLKGLFVPLITPLNPDESLDETSLERTIDYVIEGGADGIFVLGSSGEFANLSMPTKRHLIQASKSFIRGRVPLLVGIARAGTQTTIEEGQHLACFGADAFVSLPPYYFVHHQSELVTHFKTIAHTLQAPIVIYNIPPYVKHILEPETIAQLAADPLIIGIKNTDRDMDAFDKLLKIRDAHQDSFSVSQGDLPNAGECLLRGADGITLGVASIVPHLCKALYRAAKAGDRVKTEAINQKLDRVDPTGTSCSWFAGLKAQAALLGLCKPVVAKPFHAPGEDDLAILRQKLVDLDLL